MKLNSVLKFTSIVLLLTFCGIASSANTAQKGTSNYTGMATKVADLKRDELLARIKTKADKPSVIQATCRQWNVSGNWAVDQSNDYSSTFHVQQTETRLSGSAVLLESRVSGRITGNINGDRVVLQVQWHNGPLGVYIGTVSSDGQIIGGTTYDMAHRNAPRVYWRAIHRSRCVQ
jgi:hypothetical protein